MSAVFRNIPSLSLPGQSQAEYCDKLEREIKRSERLAKAVVNFFAQFLDACEIREQHDELESALTDWLTGDAKEVIAQLKKPLRPVIYASPEMLVNMCKERDRLRSLIDSTEAALDNSEMLNEMRSVVEIQLAPLRNQLEDLEEQISKIQAELEKIQEVS